MIRKRGNKYILFSKSGKKKLGTFTSRAKALTRERQIQYFKRKK